MVSKLTNMDYERGAARAVTWLACVALVLAAVAVRGDVVLTSHVSLSGYATTGAVAAVRAEVEAAASPKLTMVPAGTTVISTDTTVQVVPTRGIYNLDVKDDVEISFDLSAIDITNNVARWETWIKVFDPSVTVGLPSSNVVQYFETPDLTTTTENELLQISWQAWMDGTRTLMQASMYGRVLGAYIPTPEELRLYHYGDPNIVESPASWFVFNAGTKTITGYNYVEGRENVVIPWEIGGVAVEVLGPRAFSPNMAGHPVTNIVAGRSVLSIGYSTFASCTSLTSVSLPAATGIEGSAFYATSLTSVSLPAATYIGDNAFFGCGSLTSVSLPAATYIGYNTFASCTSLTSVTLPAATYIGEVAFASCTSLTSISLPAATGIGGGAFYATSLSSVYFGNAKPTEEGGVFTDVPGPVTIYYPAGAPAWSGVTTWGEMPTATYTPPAP